jgi:6-phosphofructokinase 1
MKRLGILTGGGDAPGLNAAVRATVKTAIIRYSCEVLGIRNGFEGLLSKNGILPLSLESVRGILPQGGTILGAANRGNPFARKVEREGESVIVDVSDQVIARINELALDCLVVVGGDGTLGIARDLHLKGVPVIGVPKTIDNDVGETDLTFGFDTAVATATEAIDRLHTTAEAHHRIMLLELMGRDAGFIALHAGIAGGADVILIPEIPFHPEAIFRKLKARIDGGTHFSIVVVSEGARPHDGDQVYRKAGDELIRPRLGGIGQVVGQLIDHALQVETRVTVLGHLQRGGSPTAFDRWLATRFGAAAVRRAASGAHGMMVALRDGRVTAVDLEVALAVPKRVDVGGDTVRTARDLGISLGDEI